MPSLDPVLTGDVPCRCGRIAHKMHCPSCGSYNHYAVMSKETSHVEQSGIINTYQVFRCRGCASYYDEWMMRNDCNAPTYATQRKRRVDQHAAIVSQQIKEIEQSDPRVADALDKIRSGEAEYGSEERKRGMAALFKNYKPPKRDE